ncbi:hypothetical protein GCM10027578_22030 [Spirosoma luteolum]
MSNQVIPNLDNKKRPSSIFLAIGAKRTGKTQGSINIQVDMWKRQAKPVLVFDIGSQSEYDTYLPIQQDDISRFNRLAEKEQYPFFVCRDCEDIDQFFTLVNQWVRNAFVVFEDATSYMAGNLSEPIRKLILNSRNLCNDYLFNLHSLAEPAPFLFRHSEYIILRRTSDVKLPPKVPVPHKIERAMAEIKAENDKKYPTAAQPKLAFRVIDITSAD